MAGPGYIDGIGQLLLVILAIVIEPHPDHGPETLLPGKPRDQFIPFRAGKRANPPDIGLYESKSLADLLFTDLCTRTLTLDIGTEGYAMNPLFEDFSIYSTQIHGGCRGKIHPRQGHFFGQGLFSAVSTHCSSSLVCFV
jgi:hypothetical protein